MQKSPLSKKYYTIGEVSELMDLPSHVLRFWEKSFPAIKPQKARGRRYYKIDDIDRLNLIKKMLYTDKMSIKAAQSILYRTSPTESRNHILPTQASPIDKQEFQGTLDLLLNKLNVAKTRLAGLL
jgi:DNA-binding transcriptional MerR regulator